MTADFYENSQHAQWQRVSRSQPCPICGKPDWCSVDVASGIVRCQRVELGAFKIGTDKNGQTYYIHRSSGTNASPGSVPPPASKTSCQRAEPGVLHRVYDALLGSLFLSSTHRDNLHKRGLVDEEIDRRLYRSLPLAGRSAKARSLADRFGADVLLSVPGFVRVEKENEASYLSLAGAPGMIVPVRDAAGLIVALKVRRDESSSFPRYSYLSSVKSGGPGSGAPVHVALGVLAPATTVRITEGELKADVATVLSGLPTLGLSGVGGWEAALPILRHLGALIVRVAFDADANVKAPVGRALNAAIVGLRAAGFIVELERWDGVHKGIDDALAAGASLEILQSDGVSAYCTEVLAQSESVGLPAEPDALDRLSAVLNEEGAEGLFNDVAILAALSRLAETNPAAYAGRRAQLKKAGVSLRDLDKALPPRRYETDAAGGASIPYRISGNRLVHEMRTARGGVVMLPLCNFTAAIVAETTCDDGALRSMSLSIEGKLSDGRPLRRIEVPAADFASMNWILPGWGIHAVVYAGRSCGDHLRAAMQLLAKDVAERTIYAHLGWRLIDQHWYYLHVDGAIGANGTYESIEVLPPDALKYYALPAPPLGDAAARALSASLDLLKLAPGGVAFPLFAAIYRAVLSASDFALHLAGQSGVFKSELAALIQQHFGAALDARHLPASWSSTSNSLEAIAFAAKDALLVVDDFAPSGSNNDVARLHREAERLLRAQGNGSGRQRMRADGGLRVAKAPRGLILSTGEDIPRGQSLRARLLVIEVERGDIDVARLSAAQTCAASGLYAEALAAFIRWLAPQYETIRGRLSAERAELRELSAGSGHARTPGIVADLALGLRYFLDFAAATGVLSEAERRELWERGWQALGTAGAAQTEQGRAADPVDMFQRLLSAALASGRAHVAAPDGGFPEAPSAWGWRRETVRGETEWRPQGRRVGWLEGDALYLEPEASYAAVQEMANAQGESMAVSAQTLRRRLRERGMLAGTSADRQKLTVRCTLEGCRRNVLHLQATLLCSKPAQPAQPAHKRRRKRRIGPVGPVGPVLFINFLQRNK